jgi:hypothetical protein
MFSLPIDMLNDLHYFLKLLVLSAKVLRSRIDEREVDMKPIEGGKKVK